MCHTTCSSTYCADCFSTELVIFVSLFAVKVCGAKREKLMNFLVSSINQEYRVLNILFLLVSAVEHQSSKTGKCCMSELMV